jgi:hypothetical protein
MCQQKDKIQELLNVIKDKLLSRSIKIPGFNSTVDSLDSTLSEYYDSLRHAVNVCYKLDIYFSEASLAYLVIAFIRGANPRTIESPFIEQRFLLDLIGNINLKSQVEILEGTLWGIDALLFFDSPDDVINKTQDFINDHKSEILCKALRKYNDNKASFVSYLQSGLNFVKSYDFLHFIIMRGILKFSGFDHQLEKLCQLVKSPNLVEEIRENTGILSDFLSSLRIDIKESDREAERSAYKVSEFVQAVNEEGSLSQVIEAINFWGNVDELEDISRIKNAVLLAANEGLIDAEIIGKEAIAEFAKLIKSRNDRAFELVNQ